MTFVDALRQILRTRPEGMTPQQLRDTIKAEYSEFYGTDSHRRNVAKGHYKDLDHALLAQIYVASRTAGDIVADRSQKPLRLTVVAGTDAEAPINDEQIDSENLEKLEAGVGTLYVLGTNLFTKECEEIIKIGITTGSVEARIGQLYTTGVPFRFRVIARFETRNYSELEQSIHKLLDPYRINKSREFFSDKSLPYVQQIVAIHNDVQAKV